MLLQRLSLALVTLASLSFAACGDAFIGDDDAFIGDDDDDDDDGDDIGPTESAVVTCYGDGCPHGECDESDGPDRCASYDEESFNPTNTSSVCDPGATTSYCVVLSTRDDGQYEFGEVQYWFVTCDDGAGDTSICVNNGCEVSSGCS